MDPQFQELAREIADAVEKRLSGTLEERIKAHIDSAETRLSGTFEERIKAHIGSAENRLSTSVDQRFQTHLDQFEKRAELRMKMHFEHLEGVVKGVADGYGGNLDRIERELKDLNEKMDTTFTDHGLVLTDHSKQISELKKLS